MSRVENDYTVDTAYVAFSTEGFPHIQSIDRIKKQCIQKTLDQYGDSFRYTKDDFKRGGKGRVVECMIVPTEYVTKTKDMRKWWFRLGEGQIAAFFRFKELKKRIG